VNKLEKMFKAVAKVKDKGLEDGAQVMMMMTKQQIKKLRKKK